MSDYNALGIELDWDEEDGATLSPLSCLVIAKALDNEGNEVYALICSKGMTNVEAAGYLKFADVHMQARILSDIYQAAVDGNSGTDYDTFVTS